MTSFHNWTGDEEIAEQVPQFLNDDNAATQEKLDTKFNNSLKITGAADLNSFKDEGLYYCNSNSQAETILNCPTNYAFGLMVWGKEDIFYQEVREFNRGSNQDYNNCWRRSYYSEGGQGVWSNWQQMSYVATTLAGYGITDGMRKDAQNSVSTMNIIGRDVNTSYLRLSGGDGIENSAYLQLCGNAYSKGAGQFRLLAADSEHSAYLLGSPSGLLTWNNKNIVRSINNVAADENGNVNIVVSGGGSGGGSNITVDAEISSTSTNPVQNKAIYNALLGKVGNEDIFNGFALRSPTASIMWRIGTQTLGSLTASNYTGTSLRATQDSDGNIINTTYAKKSDISGMVKSVNNVKPDSNGNVTIAVSGGGGGGGSIIVDDALSDTSTNAVQNKVVKAALDNRAVLDDVNTFTSPNNFDDIYMEDGINSLKWYNGSPNFVVASINSKKYTGEAATAKKATQDGNGNVITSTYATKTELNSCVKSVNNVTPDSNGNVNISVSVGSNVTVDTTLSATSTNPIANKTVYSALSDKLGKTETAYAATKATQDGYGNVITSTYARKVDLASYVKTVNNTAPDENGNVTIDVSGGGGGSDITVDAELSATSTNPVQNKVIKGALDDKANLNKNNTFSKENYFQKGMSLIAYRDLDSAIKWYQSPVDPPIASIDATNYTGTAAKATQDGAGNIITETYAKKADVSGVVKSVNGTKPDTDGNVVIDVSGGGSGAYLPLTGGTVTGGITAPNFQTGTGAANYFQCQKFRGEGNANSYYHAIDFGYSGHDSVDFYEYDPNWNFYKCTTGTKSGAVLVGNIDGNGWNGGARLSGTPTAPTAVAGTNTTQIATTAFVQSAIPTNVSSFTNDAGYIKSVNNTKPDSNGNVTITVSGGGGVSTSESNTWTGKQTFQKMKFNFESYNAPRISGATDNPSSSVAVYNVQGNFTLDMSTLAGLLSNGDATVFTAYITANGSYTLSIINAGTLKYAGSATDLAITANGLLLNIMLIKSSSGVLSSVAQASTLS